MRLVIFGTVGAGKTSFINALNKKLGYKVYAEPLNINPYFDKLYEQFQDKNSNTYKMELFMLTERMKQFLDSQSLNDVIFDRGVMDTLIFANANYEEGNLDKRDWDTYRTFFETNITPAIFSYNNVKGYDLVVYLRVTNQTSIARINQRAIPGELRVKTHFWELLNGLYEQWYLEWTDKIPFVVIDGNIDSIDEKVEQFIKKIR
ncbi:deoxynucleoside kinase [Spiroplasma sabaudiense Ar-1343]|uniref:Deoxynucleoside kinase n=1 Tax=Spiroplasma sabaudiense Ar-1343 TaxID=1276257 RepID=W6AJP8_9MOLU|nr:deoxynucleoside kinase [Spiroplasma sabaudiense]AHI53954.1 deoxynucleoside kinase [Spiroplasma sabaudiense Ar-1343]